jgi:hypothetical protein
MHAINEDTLQAILEAYGFHQWASRQEGRRLRCPHGLLIGLAEDCPVGCISPLVVLGLLDPVDLQLDAATQPSIRLGGRGSPDER